MPIYGSNLSVHQQMNGWGRCGMHTHTHTHTDTNTTQPCSIYSSMDGLGQHYAKGNVSQRKADIWYHLYVESDTTTN